MLGHPDVHAMAGGSLPFPDTCYQQADEATVLAVMACPTKLMSKKFRGNG